jgi:uncharacterized protein (DUF305 family)
MADLALTRTTNARVRHLATAIKAAQDPEVQQMSGKDAQAIELAKKIEADQTREIGTMNTLLAALLS